MKTEIDDLLMENKKLQQIKNLRKIEIIYNNIKKQQKKHIFQSTVESVRTYESEMG